jgi:hypothetical protein
MVYLQIYPKNIPIENSFYDLEFNSLFRLERFAIEKFIIYYENIGVLILCFSKNLQKT